MRIQSSEFVKSCAKLSDCPTDQLSEIALVGRSNVGKSSLLNSLLGRKGLAKTSRTPGKTRLINFFRVTVNLGRPLNFYMVDLPGYGFANVSIAQQAAWGRLIEDYLAQCPSLRLLILLLDIRRIPSPLDLQLLHWIEQYRTPVFLVVTKSDQVPLSQQGSAVEKIRASLPRSLVQDDVLIFSSKTGQGKLSLLSKIAKFLQDDRPGGSQFSSQR